MAKRRRCLSCAHADVIRYARYLCKFPMGVFCNLDESAAGKDPRDYIRPCDGSCGRWHESAKKRRTSDGRETSQGD